MSKGKNSKPTSIPSGKIRNNPGGRIPKPKGQVPTMTNPPPPPKK